MPFSYKRTNHFDIFLRFICVFSFTFPNWCWIFSSSSRVLPLCFCCFCASSFCEPPSKCWTSCFVCACRASMNVEPNVCAITRTRAFFRCWFLVVFPFFFLLIWMRIQCYTSIQIDREVVIERIMRKKKVKEEEEEEEVDRKKTRRDQTKMNYENSLPNDKWCCKSSSVPAKQVACVFVCACVYAMRHKKYKYGRVAAEIESVPHSEVGKRRNNARAEQKAEKNTHTHTHKTLKENSTKFTRQTQCSIYATATGMLCVRVFRCRF